MTTPSCPVCGAKFSWDPAAALCKKCGVTAELLRVGGKPLARWKRFYGYGVAKATLSRRRRLHGRVRGRGRVLGGTPRVRYRRKKEVRNG